MRRTSFQRQLAKLLLRKQDSVKDRKATPPGPDRAPLWSKTQNTHLLNGAKRLLEVGSHTVTDDTEPKVVKIHVKEMSLF